MKKIVQIDLKGLLDTAFLFKLRIKNGFLQVKPIDLVENHPSSNAIESQTEKCIKSKKPYHLRG